MARTTGRHRRTRRNLPLPAAAGAAAVTVAMVGSAGLGTAGASETVAASLASTTTVALDAPARPALGSAEASDAFAGISAASDALAAEAEKASVDTHTSIREDEKKAEKERKRKEAEERAAREAAERERLARMFTKPLDSYQVSAQYGVRGWMWARGYHTGIDLTAAYGSPVKAVHSGTVTFAGWDGAYGYKVEITHPDGTQTWYAHMSSIAVSSGQVTTGQTIGHVGSTGNSYGNHLHLEVHSPSGELNPYTWLQGKGVTL
jgi:murein DD-endopeptidase MepM/ murein hydrolase activator NlpD